MTRRCVFIDRDDTIAKDVPYCDSPDKFVLFPGIPEQIRRLNDAGFLVIMITNQSGINRGYFTEDTLKAIHEKMNADIEAGGGHIDDIFYYLNQEPTTDGATMTLTLANGTTSETKNIWIREGERLKNQYPIYTVFCLAYNGNTWRVVNGIVPESTNSVIAMNGVRSAGTSPNYARADHVHPTDTTRASTSVATVSSNGLMTSTDKQKVDSIGKHLTNENIDELFTQGLYWIDSNSGSTGVNNLPIRVPIEPA